MLGTLTYAATGQVAGKISRNVYRPPYIGSGQFAMIVDYVDHGGSMDSRSQSRVCAGNVNLSCSSHSDCADAGVASPCDYVLVAPADGIICTVIEHFDDCGGTVNDFGPFGNVIVILHANGEASRHLHIKQNSASLFGITAGMFVFAGQPIALEGDVGRTQGGTETACGTDGPPRVGTCLESVPSGATNCFRHNHWNVIRYTTGEVLEPLTCGISSNIYQSGMTYNINACGTSGSYPTNFTASNMLYSRFGTSKVVQAHDTISASSITVQNQASVVYHAGSRVQLRPGFHAQAGGYFRAECAPPESTAPSDWPVPGTCPCEDVVGYCYQWSDPGSPDGTTQGCSPPGPNFNSCHGCFIGGRCCPCVLNGTCQAQGGCPG